jgi:hypothetical protein
VTRERALEIIGAYGADAARWPDTERAALLSVVARDAEVAAALGEARRFDVMLAGWADDVPVRRYDADALLPARILRVPQRSRLLRWAGGGAVAAALATLLVLTVPGMLPAPQPTMPANIAPDFPQGSVRDSDSNRAEPLEGFALIFTPTADEEELI